MSEKILAALDAITNVVLSYRSAAKGQASAKIANRVKREKKREAQDDRESSI